MTKSRYDNDRAWSRSKPKPSTKKKRNKVCSRASVRLLASLMKQKRLTDRHKGLESTTCVTRTVELPSTQVVGEESSKLLFMLAIGLMPKVDKPKKQCPVVSLARLDPKVEAEAKARTKEIIFKIFEERKKELLRERIVQMNQFPHSPPHHHSINYQNRRFSNPQSEPSTSPPPINGVVDVECVDLVSSEDEDSPESIDDSEPEVITEMDINSYCQSDYPMLSIIPIKSPCFRENQRLSTPSPPPPEKVLYCSKPWLQKKVHNNNHAHAFKSLINNQTQGGQLFRNFKPESLSRIMNLPPSSENSATGSSENSRSKFLSSLKSIPTTTTPFSVGTTSFMSRKPSAASKGPMTTKNSIGDNTLESEQFILTDDIITID